MRFVVALVIFAACATPLPPQTVIAANGDVLLEPPRDENEVVHERQGHLWAHGRWTWEDNQWTWLGGHWLELRPGQTWTDGHWEKRGKAWHYVDGSWVTSASTPEP